MEKIIEFMNLEFSNPMLEALLFDKEVSKNRTKRVKEVYL